MTNQASLKLHQLKEQFTRLTGVEAKAKAARTYFKEHELTQLLTLDLRKKQSWRTIVDELSPVLATKSGGLTYTPPTTTYTVKGETTEVTFDFNNYSTDLLRQLVVDQQRDAYEALILDMRWDEELRTQAEIDEFLSFVNTDISLWTREQLIDFRITLLQDISDSFRDLRDTKDEVVEAIILFEANAVLPPQPEPQYEDDYDAIPF